MDQKERTATTLSEAERETLRKQVRERFDQLVTALDKKDAHEWSELYSKDGFLSAFAGTDSYATRSAWVNAITSHFAARETQHVEPFAVQVTPLTADLALMTSEEKIAMRLKNGQALRVTHVFTILWRKEEDGWKILHSHESWVDDPQK